MSAQFTPQQLRHYAAYERVRSSGKWSMFDPKARAATKLDRDEYLFVQRNYEALRYAARAAGSAT